MKAFLISASAFIGGFIKTTWEIRWLIVLLLSFALAAFLFVKFKQCSKPLPPNVEQHVNGYVKPQDQPISHSEANQIVEHAIGKPITNQTGVLTVTTKDTILPGTIYTILIGGPGETPWVGADTNIIVHYSSINAAWVAFCSDLDLGISVSTTLQPSPLVGWTPVKIVGKVGLGAAISRAGFGPQLNYEVAENLKAVAVWNAIPFGSDHAIASLGFAYTFKFGG